MDIAITAAVRGLDRAQTQLNRAAVRISRSDNTSDVVSLSEEAVQLLQAKNDFAANIRTIKVADEMTREALSLNRRRD